MSDEQGSTFATMAELIGLEDKAGGDAPAADEPTAETEDAPSGASDETIDMEDVSTDAVVVAANLPYVAGSASLVPAHPKAIDVWVVDAVLGGGSDAVVFAAHNVHATRIRAAIKVPATGAVTRSGTHDQFLEEARLLVGLRHPNIVSVRNLRLDHVPPFIEMHLVDGPRLEERIRRGPMSGMELLTTAAGLCSAVGYLGVRGIHHRDLKPSNVLLGEAGPVIVDFGMACTTEESAAHPLEGAQGSLGYLPPEWAPDECVDGDAWDRYALGVMLFECCTGQVAFAIDPERSRLEQLPAVQRRVRDAGPLDPGLGVPRGLRALIGRLTATDAAIRAVDIPRVADLLARLVSGDEAAGTALLALVDPRWAATLAEPSSAHPLVRSEARPDQRWAMGRALVAVALLGAGGWALRPLWSPPVASTGGAVSVRLALSVHPTEVPLPVAFLLDDKIFDAAHRPVLEPGDRKVGVRVGVDCGVDALPHWCGEVAEVLFVEDDAREHIFHTLELPEVSAHPVTLHIIGETPERFRIDSGAWTSCAVDTPCVPELLPGPERRLTLQAGRCPDEPCGGNCPTACSEQTVTMAVDFQLSSALSIAIDLPPLQVRLAPASPATASSTTKAKSPSPGLGAPITVGMFQQFIRENPQYAPGGAGTKDKTDGGYLNGWQGDQPMRGGRPVSLSLPVGWVSPAMFEAFCHSKGSTVAHADDGPIALAPGTRHELRRNGSGWDVHTPGEAKPSPAGVSTSSLTGFTVRCRR